MKKFIVILFILASLTFFYAMQKAFVKEFIPFDIKKALLQKVNKKTLEEKILQALKQENPQEAKKYLELANFLNIAIDNNLTTKVKKANSTFNVYKTNTKNFLQGFISGKANNSASLAGVITSDFTLIGDLRDIYYEGKKMQEGKEYDKFTLSLSILGVALSASAISSFGSSLALKSETALIKNANKMYLLKAPFKKEILTKLEKTVDFNTLKKIDFSSIKSIKKDITIVKRSIHLKPIQNFLLKLHTLQKNSSLEGTLTILKYIHNEKELQKAVKLSKKYKKLTPLIFKTLGREALRSGKWIIKKASYYSYLFIGFILSLLGAFISFIFVLKKSYSLFSS